MSEQTQDLKEFEPAIEELESIVERLDAGGLSLQETLDLFERGQALADLCNRLLDEAALRLEKLQPVDDGPEAVPFDVDE